MTKNHLTIAHAVRHAITVGAVMVSLTLAGLAHAQQWTTNGNDIYSSNSGNVGVGTLTPAGKLEVVGSWPAPAIRMSDTGTGYASFATSQQGFGFLTAAGAAGNVNAGGLAISSSYFTTPPTNGLYVQGNVGIGTTNPVSLLHLNNAAPDTTTAVSIGGGGGCSSIVANNFYPSQYRSGGPAAQVGAVDDCNWSAHLIFSTAPGGNGTSLVERMRITDDGKVGIGTTTPSSKLEIVGDVTVSGNISAKYQDIAEWVPASEQMPPGTVVILDSNKPNSVMPSDQHVAGVVSAMPGLILGEQGEHKVKVATTGRVKVRVDARKVLFESGTSW